MENFKLHANVNIHLVNNYGIEWSQGHYNGIEIWSKGSAFFRGHFFEDDSFVRIILQQIIAHSSDGKLDWVHELNGSFVFVIRSSEFFFAAVDRIRSMPLFYGTLGGSLYVSDDASWIRNQVGDVDFDEIAVVEFLLTGYTTGSDTLFPSVKQLQAGEYLWVNTEQTPYHFELRRYFRWIHENYFDASEEELCKALDQMHVQVFERLLESTRGRTIVVPLSGGYDSRLIVTMLKRLGRENVLCFSYGVHGNWEAAISREVARKLGYPWKFVPWSHSHWRKWFRASEQRSYFGFSSGLCSNPHTQDWSAVWEMKRAGQIPLDAVFVPGHSGDFVAGSHIPKDYAILDEVGEKRFLLNIMEKHYRLWNWRATGGNYSDSFVSRILSRMESLSYTTPDEAANSFEYWDWQERQAKFIVNSLRAYEFWGYSWRIPFWDNEVMDFWSHIPLRERIGESLYINCLNKLFGKFDLVMERKVNWVERLPILSKYLSAFDSRLGAFGLQDYSECLIKYRSRYHANFRSLRCLTNVNTLISYQVINYLTKYASLPDDKFSLE